MLSFIQNIGIVADMTSYNILLKACCLSERVDLAQDIYREVQHMESTGALKIDVFTYSTIIKVFFSCPLRTSLMLQFCCTIYLVMEFLF